MTDPLAKLEALTRMILDGELARLRQAARTAEAARAQLRALDAQKRQRAEEITAMASQWDPAQAAGQDARWLEWVARERARRAAEAARLASELEARRLEAKRAFGRVDALSRLSERHAFERRQTAARRLTPSQE